MTSDKSYKHYQFLQEKKKRQKEKAMAEFDAMSKYLNNAYTRAEKFISDCVKLSEQLKEQRE